MAAGATLLYLLCFTCLMRNKQEDSAEKKKKKLDKKITDYLLYLLWLALQAHKNMAQLIRTLSDYILIMVGFASDTVGWQKMQFTCKSEGIPLRGLKGEMVFLMA